eukprot:5076316-Pyramimonas_sp.AAC.1
MRLASLYLPGGGEGPWRLAAVSRPRPTSTASSTSMNAGPRSGCPWSPSGRRRSAASAGWTSRWPSLAEPVVTKASNAVARRVDQVPQVLPAICRWPSDRCRRSWPSCGMRARCCGLRARPR